MVVESIRHWASDIFSEDPSGSSQFSDAKLMVTIIFELVFSCLNLCGSPSRQLLPRTHDSSVCIYYVHTVGAPVKVDPGFARVPGSTTLKSTVFTLIHVHDIAKTTVFTMILIHDIAKTTVFAMILIHEIAKTTVFTMILIHDIAKTTVFAMILIHEIAKT